MTQLGKIFVATLTTSLLLAAGTAQTAEHCPHCGRERCAQQSPFERAGKPFCVHRFAAYSTNAKYAGGYVGGGTVLRGEARCPDEGTWGLDYMGLIPIKRIWLDWSHHRHQAGGGSYRTDH